MSDVFDEDLMRELGIEPEDMVAAAKRPVAPAPKPVTPTPTATAQSTVAKAPQPVAPKAPAKLEASFTTEVNKTKPATPTASPARGPANTPKVATAATDDLAQHGEQLADRLPVHVAAVMAKKSLSLKDIMELRSGDVLNFDKLPEDPIDLVVNGKLVAKAELVLVDGKVAARVLKLMR